MDLVNRLLSKHREAGRGFLSMPPVLCADGFEVSVQASKYHYSSPRNASGPYVSVELGFPSKADDLIKEYAEDPETPTETVYGYVPVDVVERLLVAHGGVVAVGQMQLATGAE